MNLLRHFIIGGSFPVISTFYYGVYHMQPKKNYSYFNYTLIAPLYFGLFNICAIECRYNIFIEKSQCRTHSENLARWLTINLLK